MELGALLCTPRQPDCSRCPLQSQCEAHRSRRTDQLPRLAPRPVTTARRLIAFLVHKNGCYLVRQRPSHGVNADLWEFPNLEIEATFPLPHSAPPKFDPNSLRHRARQELGLSLADLRYLSTVRHSITRYRIELTAFHADWDKGSSSRTAPRTHRWLDLDTLKKLPFTSAHRRLVKSLNPNSCCE
jgi:A/G-specific adenine glycosylase